MRIPFRASQSTAPCAFASRGKFALVVLSALCTGTLANVAGAQEAGTSAPPAGCTLHKDVYTCNLDAFRQRLTAAHTVGIETQRDDRFTAAQLRKLIVQMGKTVATEDQPAGLTFLLIPIETAGIQYGPAAQPLATLRVYAPGPATSRGTLLWAETWTGHQDRPWPSIVQALLEQFKERVTTR
ncbi:MAG: hypothetical protein ACRYFU_08375 [Janthinobacterium lividum]